MAQKRKLPPTGFWIFVCNPKVWAADRFLESGERDLWYQVSRHNGIGGEVQAGQLGLLRIGKDARTLAQRDGYPKLDAGVYAIVEVLGPAVERTDPDPDYYLNADDAAEISWKAPIRIIENLVSRPILLPSLPSDDAFKYIHRPLQTSTIPLSAEAFMEIVNLAGSMNVLARLARQPLSVKALASLEDRLSSEQPVVRRRLSRGIERGTIGKKVKNIRGSRCQVCEQLGQEPVAFTDSRGRPFAEAHHVVPVRLRRRGSLSHLNIMVLCPNHHRQAHFGNFEIEKFRDDRWEILLDGQRLEIEKTSSIALEL